MLVCVLLWIILALIRSNLQKDMEKELISNSVRPTTYAKIGDDITNLKGFVFQERTSFNGEYLDLYHDNHGQTVFLKDKKVIMITEKHLASPQDEVLLSSAIEMNYGEYDLKVGETKIWFLKNNFFTATYEKSENVFIKNLGNSYAKKLLFNNFQV